MHWQIHGVGASFLISLIGLGFIVYTKEPQLASISVKSLFFITIFILIWSVMTLSIFFIKKRLIRSQSPDNKAYELFFYDSFFFGLVIAIVTLLVLVTQRFF